MVENMSLSQKLPKALEQKHLHAGVDPIRAGMVDISLPIDGETLSAIHKIRESGDNVDYFEEDDTALSERGLLSSVFEKGKSGYAISSVNEHNKFSEGYRYCTGLVVVGKKKDGTGNISFISHQDPAQVIAPQYQEGFKKAVTRSIEKIVEECEPGTIDAMIVGGSAKKNAHIFSAGVERYKDVITALSGVVSQVLGFEPVVVTGPNAEAGDTAIYFENDTRHLFFERRAQENNNLEHPYSPSEIDKQSEGWDL